MRYTHRNVSCFPRIFALAVGMVVLGAAAHAYAVDVTPDSIEFYPGVGTLGPTPPGQTAANYVLIQSGGVNYVAATSVPSLSTATNGIADCSPYGRSQETIRTWLSLSQSALLSGKKLTIAFGTCNGVNFINTIVLRR